MESTNTSGFLVVSRTKWATLQRTSAVREADTGRALSALEVVARYRGFDGEPWPSFNGIHPPSGLESGLAPPELMDLVLTYYRAIQETDACDLLYIDRGPGQSKSMAGARLDLLGIDYGYYESEWSFFSSIFHECVFGRYGQLCSFAGSLNESLLFSTIEVCEAFASARRRLLDQGADLEDDQACQAIRILAPSWIA